MDMDEYELEREASAPIDMLETYFGALVACDPDIRKSEKLEDMIVLAPDRPKLILRPAALEIGDDLLLAAALIGPAVSVEIMFEHVDRSARLALHLELVNVHHSDPVLFARISIRPDESASIPEPRTTICCG